MLSTNVEDAVEIMAAPGAPVSSLVNDIRRMTKQQVVGFKLPNASDAEVFDNAVNISTVVNPGDIVVAVLAAEDSEDDDGGLLFDPGAQQSGSTDLVLGAPEPGAGALRRQPNSDRIKTTEAERRRRDASKKPSLAQRQREQQAKQKDAKVKAAGSGGATKGRGGGAGRGAAAGRGARRQPDGDRIKTTEAERRRAKQQEEADKKRQRSGGGKATKEGAPGGPSQSQLRHMQEDKKLIKKVADDLR